MARGLLRGDKERWIGRQQQRGESEEHSRTRADENVNGENTRYAKKIKRGKGGGISFVTPETERCQRARPLINAPPISTRQASFFFVPAG